MRDPLGTELVVTSGPALMGLVLGDNSPTGLGVGDCDEACTFLGAAARSIGFPVRIVTSIGPGKRNFSHVYPEIQVDRLGWIPFDAVVFPRAGFGEEPRATFRQRWTLEGVPINTEGARPMLGEAESMYDYGLENYGLAGTDGAEPDDWATYGLLGFGSLAGEMGILPGLGLLAEVEEDEITGLARTPMIEVNPSDFRYLQTYGAPYHGMLALGDDGSVYQYDGLNGFFSKIFSGAKGLVKGALKVGRKIISKLPGGKYLIKLHDKLHGVAMKLIKPLAKIVPPSLVKKVAGVAAIIPGYGPVISAALYTGGEVLQMAKKYGVHQDKKGGFKFKHPKQFSKFQAALKAKAEHERKTKTLRKKHAAKVAKAHKGKVKGKKERKAVKPGHLPAGTAQALAAMRAWGMRPMYPFPQMMPGGYGPPYAPGPSQYPYQAQQYQPRPPMIAARPGVPAARA